MIRFVILVAGLKVSAVYVWYMLPRVNLLSASPRSAALRNSAATDIAESQPRAAPSLIPGVSRSSEHHKQATNNEKIMNH